MASFSEQATLKVIDQSSATIRKINAELRKLDATAKALRSRTINLNVNARGIQQALNQMRALQQAARTAGTTRVNLHVNAQGIAQALQQINRLRQQAARPINVNTRATGGGGGGGGIGGHGGGALGSRSFGLGGAARGAASVLVGGTAYAIAANLVRNAIEGVKEVDTGRTSLMLKQLDRVYGEHSFVIAEGMLNASQEAITRQPYGGAFWNIGQRTQNFSEALGITQARDTRPGRGRPSGMPEFRPALAVTYQLEEMSRTLVGLGQSSEKANEQAINFAKGLEQTGRFTDRLTGAFDTAKMEEGFDYFRQLAPTIGKEFSGDFARNLIKYLSTEKYTVSNRALGAVMLMGEEMGTRAAVGYHQAVKQLSGMGQKKPQLAFLREEELLKATGFKTVGKGKRAKQVPTGFEAVDADLLREDLPAWLEKHAVPILEKRGRAEAKKQLESGEISRTQVDAFVEKYKTDPNKIAALAYKMVGDRTAVETVAGFLERSQEIQRQLNEVALRSGKPEDIRKATEFSINIATAQLQNQFKGALGTMAQSAAPWLVPQMQRASAEFSKISTDFQAAAQKGAPPLDAIERISSALTPLAIGGAIAAAVSDPSKAPAAAATIGLITAGNLLIKAANKMLGKSEDEGPQPFGTPPDTPEGVLGQELRRQRSLTREELKTVQTQLKKTESDIAEDKKIRDRYELANRANPNRRPREGETKTYNDALRRIQAYESTAKTLTDRISALEAKLAAQDAQIMKTDYETITGKVYDEKMRLYMEARRDEAKAAEAERAYVKSLPPPQRKAYWAAKSKEVPLPRPRPPDIVEDPVKVTPVPTPVSLHIQRLLEQLRKGTPVVPTTPGMPGVPTTPPAAPPAPRPISEVIDMTSMSASFSSLFSAGAIVLGDSGKAVGSNAAGTMEGRASAIGGAIGAAAAARIASATVNVNIPNQAPKGDPGAQPVP